MSPEKKTLRVRIGAVTLGSMMMTLVLLAVLLVASDLRASQPGISQEFPATGTSDGITSFAVDTLPALGVVVGPNSVRTAYVVRSKAGTEVFVYTRNSDGILTDPD
jgi:hypothetical protein